MTLRKAFCIALATRFLILPFVTFFGSILADMARNLARASNHGDLQKLVPEFHDSDSDDLRYFSLFQYCDPPENSPQHQMWVESWDDDYSPSR